MPPMKFSSVRGSVFGDYSTDFQGSLPSASASLGVLWRNVLSMLRLRTQKNHAVELHL